ncbi:protein FAM161A [Melanotaenia boesemani]|uniref:protein FAM161A n=1 Tax=Melanotaenia boesemani TaxID=1250792 RepID=UPI001C04A941|nr:protein FAM161A [Melanotaenia boesemani]XP_041827961.1 protein FAM161A [Melanotaenia boesemani]XP_041827962.1 protein FAM161A [Melanotaenia boesemani]
MSKLDTLREERISSELMLQLHLKTLRKALRQQLLETEKRQSKELEKRIYQNALLSADVDKKSGGEEELNYKIKLVGMRTSAVISAHVSQNETSHHLKQRPLTSCPPWVPSTKWKPLPVRTQLCERFASTKTTELTKEEEAEAECQKKFCAVPVPSHVNQPIYQEMIEVRKRERKQGHEQRKLFLISIQKPFSFHEREKKKQEKPMATLNQASQNPKINVHVRKVPHKDIKDSPELKATTAQQENPAQTGSTKPRTAECTRKKKTGIPV